MSRKIIIHLAFISFINIYCSSFSLKSNFSIIDSICKNCLSLKSMNNVEENSCEKYQVLCDFQNMIQYIGERLMTAKKVAIAKWDTKDPIIDPIREEQVLDTVAKQSEDLGLDPLWAKRFFRDQIDANVYLQQRLHELWNKSGFRPNGPPVDLVTEIRPIIDQLNKDLIHVSHVTKSIRSTNLCNLFREFCAEKTARSLSLDSIERKAFEIAQKNVCQ